MLLVLPKKDNNSRLHRGEINLFLFSHLFLKQCMCASKTLSFKIVSTRRLAITDATFEQRDKKSNFTRRCSIAG